ncbi:polyribonucleotide nucleotidyltransferase [Babesia ovata]|uniref:Polyribonucleotide nucleotidyltransferase n=1 Tax=Babesia ovata TaxID=189622 RepID=A0A2H6K6X9_9APIC|nr:polyribonucleotide nucleotidyltransferase [Babesia ovata]GBE58741.1 polyribonucleotide nucleotidyltransferase [Babesia ovata]
MDRSYDFKRRATHWQMMMREATRDTQAASPEHQTVDRFSVISADVFAQLRTLKEIISPYTVLAHAGHGSKESIGGHVKIPLLPNAMGYIHAKRALFEQTDIKDIVHDTRHAGDLIKQMATSIEEELKRMRRGTISRQLQEHRLGVIACLQHTLKAVESAVEEYERYRLKVETNVTASLRLMTENQVKEYRIRKGYGAEGSADKQIIAQDYLKLFMEESNRGSTLARGDGSAAQGSESVSASTSSSPRLGPSMHAGTITPALRRQPSVQMPHMPVYMDYVDAPQEQNTQVLQMQHKNLVAHVQQSIQANELKTINGVQQRLSEISSMFEQFSGTLAVQLDMFESINANVLESLSNIETTETSLKKADTEGMPYYQLLMCYSFIGSAVFLLLVDYLKSSRGSYIL